MKRNLAVALLLASTSPIAASSGEFEQELQPGILHIAGMEKHHRVSLNSEEIPRTGLERAGYRLLTAPGTYRVTFHTGDGKSCSRQVRVKEQAVATVRSCAAVPINSQSAD